MYVLQIIVLADALAVPCDGTQLALCALYVAGNVLLPACATGSVRA
jgi:hypothetical protein